MSMWACGRNICVCVAVHKCFFEIEFHNRIYEPNLKAFLVYRGSLISAPWKNTCFGYLGKKLMKMQPHSERFATFPRLK